MPSAGNLKKRYNKTMAEEKPKAKPKETWETTTVDLSLILLLAALISGAILPVIIQLLMGVGLSDAFRNILNTFLKYYRFMATMVSVLFLTGITYCLIRINQIRKAEASVYNIIPSLGPLTTPEAEIKRQRNQKWLRVEQLMESANPSDWRLAIIEADILLDEMISRMPYQGETLADKMKKVEKSDFSTIESAWEAHKARNQIAHAGSDYVLTEHEAKRVINLYREVFQEFFFI